MATGSSGALLPRVQRSLTESPTSSLKVHSINNEGVKKAGVTQGVRFSPVTSSKSFGKGKSLGGKARDVLPSGHLQKKMEMIHL